MNRPNLFLAATMLCALLLAPSITFAQTVTATLYGNVADETGAAVPQATVTIKNEGTGATVTATTDEAGEYTFNFLPVGNYTMQVTRVGFKELTRPNLELDAGQRIRLNSTLEPGAVTESVTVTAETPLINNVSPEQREAINEVRVKELPTLRRDWTGLLTTTPGTTIGNASGNPGGVSLNGLPQSAVNFTVDGTDASQNPEANSTTQFGGFNIIKGVSLEAIQEVAVTKGIFPAEYSNSLSGNVNVITRGGTNEYHGTAFINYQSDRFNARYAFPQTNTPSVQFRQFGGSFGGPLYLPRFGEGGDRATIGGRNKLFFFAVYEGYRSRNFAPLTVAVATPEFRQRAIAAVPAYRQFFDLEPLPNRPYTPGANQGLFDGAAATSGNDNHVTARVDYNITDTDLLNVRYTRGRPDSSSPTNASFSPLLRSFIGQNDALTANFVTTRRGISAETRFGFRRSVVDRLDDLYSRGVPGLRLTDNTGTALNRISIRDDGEIFSTRGDSYTVEEVLAANVGRNALKFGGIFQHQNQSRFNVEQPSIRYTSVADFLQNIPSQAQYTFGLDRYLLSYRTLGFFAQDDFKFSPRLTINFGLRYDYYSVPKERDDRLFNRVGPYAAANDLRPADRIYEPDFNNFSPRLGFAYSPESTGRTVVRGGVGVFHSQTLFADVLPLVGQSDSTIPVRRTFTRAEVLALRAQGREVGYGVTNNQVLAVIRGAALAAAIGDTSSAENPTPYSVQYTLGVQRQLTNTLAIEAAYVGNRAENLPYVQSLNLPDRVTGARPYPNIAQFRFRDKSDRSNYNALQVELRKRFASDFSLDVNYTFAKSLSYQFADLQTQGTTAEPNEPGDLELEYGPSPYDVRHRFVTSFIYELPIARYLGTNSRAVDLLLGGFQVSGIFRAQTGNPLNISPSTVFPGERIDYVGGDLYLSNSSDPLRYLNPAAFAAVPRVAASGRAARPGTLGRNALNFPGFNSTDLALAKNFRITERVRFQIRADLFNAFNQVNYNAVSTNVTATNFGFITGAQSARQVQFNGRLTF